MNVCSVVSLWHHGLLPIRLLCPWDSQGQNAGVGCHFPLQGLFLTQGSNLGLLPCRQILYHLRHQGRPQVAEVHIKGMISVSLDPCIFPWGASRVALVVKNLPAYAGD